MPFNLHELSARIASQIATLQGVGSLVTALCVTATLLAVAVNFKLAARGHSVRTERRSAVATGSMLGFLALFYLLIRLRVGVYVFETAYPVMAVAGMLLLVAGAAVNIMGRFALGQNWGNQVIIYQDHTLVTGGMYRLVRHPLYASIIWMFAGASLVYQNWASLAAMLVIFVPAMYWRGKLEEAALLAQFPAYREYQRKTGMFIPFL